MSKELVIFEERCIDLGIKYEIKNVKKYDPKTRTTIWNERVAFPIDTDGFKLLLSDRICRMMLMDKLSIVLRAQNDPRKGASMIEKQNEFARGHGFNSFDEMIELAKVAKAAKLEQV